MRRTFDVIVVGGGCLGHSVAFELGGAGLQTLMVYPRGHGLDSATLAAGAMIGAFGELTHTNTGPREEQKLEFRVRSQELYPTWLKRLTEASRVQIETTPGIVMIANGHGRQDVVNLEHIQRQLERYGRQNEWVDPADVPGLAPGDAFPTTKALFIPEDLSVDSAQLMEALGAAVAATPACTVRDDRVVELEQVGTDWAVVTQQGERFQASHVVVCAGARVAGVLGEQLLPALRLPTLFFAKGIGCVVSGSPRFPHTIRTTNRADACGVHVVPRAGGRLYIGASNHYGYAVAAARGLTPGEVAAILGDTSQEINRHLRDTTIEELRFGLRPVTADGVPLVGRTALPGLLLATGTFRTGIVMAPRIAQVIASEIQHPGEATANPFRPDPDRYDDEPDMNVPNLHANRGLEAFNRLQGGDPSARAVAIAHWKKYLDHAGEHGDARIRDMLQQLETEAPLDTVVW